MFRLWWHVLVGTRNICISTKMKMPETSQFHIISLPDGKMELASSGNRTRAARVAGEHSTTEPTMLIGVVLFLWDLGSVHNMFRQWWNTRAVKRNICISTKMRMSETSQFHIILLPNGKMKLASSGNRTRAARMEGEHSTTEPTMLMCVVLFLYTQYDFSKRNIMCFHQNEDDRDFSVWHYIITKWQNGAYIVRESNPGRPRGRRAFYHWTNDAYVCFFISIYTIWF